MNAIADALSVDDVHLTLPTADRAASARLYDILLGTRAAERWAVSNGSIGLADSDRRLTVDLHVADLAGAATLLRRRGVALDDRGESDGMGKSLALTEYAPLRVTGYEMTGGGAPGATSSGMIDHVVFTVAEADAAIALFGGRLGVNLRLVRDLGKGVSQLFFRTRSTVLEVVAGAPDTDEGIGLMGVAWRCSDIVAEQRRLVDAGLNVSEVRTGRKAGTEVCTVREPALGTATLLIQQ